MKKILVILILLFLIIIFSIFAISINKKNSVKALKKFNSEYEQYLGKTVYGADLATLINKIMYENENNKIAKDEKNYFIANEENSIKMEIKISSTGKTYPMEEIYNKNTEEFVKYFDVETFKCVEINYHKKTGKISNIIFEQI